MTRFLLDASIDVVEVNQPHPHLKARRLAFLDAQINAGDIEYDQAKPTSKTASPSLETATRST